MVVPFIPKFVSEAANQPEAKDPSMTARTSALDGMGCSTTDYVDSRAKSLSAIAAFTNLVSTSHRFTPESTSTLGVSCKLPNLWFIGAHSLPTEIIRMIFQFVFESCVSLKDDVDGDDLALWLDEDSLSPSLFPYSLACVCLRWFRILKTIPIYWTRPVIALDAVAASLNAARTTLQWASNRPLKVMVTRHYGTSEKDDSERASIRLVMQLLHPHIDCIWSLSFDVEHSSSIPALWLESGHARRLKALTLLSRSDAGYISPSLEWLPAGNSHRYKGRLKAPHVQEVTFGGLFFRNFLMAYPGLASWFRHVTSLTICGGATSSGSAISLYKFLSVIDIFPSVRELTVEDVHFDDNAPYPTMLTLKPAVLCLRRITGKTALQGILTRARVGNSQRAHITITDCDIHGFRESYLNSNLLFSSVSLTVASMDSIATIEDLVCRWNGEKLTLIDCPRVSRLFLNKLQGEAAPTGLSRLEVVDCDNVNAGDLISLVSSRETQARFVSLMGVPDDDSFAALVELRVQGRGPPISVKRARWLAEHVETFSWDTVAKDGLRYVWDGSAGRLMVSLASGSLEASTSPPRRLGENGRNSLTAARSGLSQDKLTALCTQRVLEDHPVLISTASAPVLDQVGQKRLFGDQSG